MEPARVTVRSGSAVTACLVAAALFGIATPVSKLLLGTIPPITLAGLLYVGAAAAVLPFVRRGASTMRRDPANVARLAGAVVAGGMVAPVLLLVGLARAPAASVALWLNLEVVTTAVLARVFFREHLGAAGWGAVVVVFVAGLLLADPSGASPGAAAVLVAGAAICWAVDNNLTSLIDGFTPAQYTVVKGLVAGATNLAIGLVVERTTGGVATYLVALAVGGIAYGVSLMLYVAGAQALGAARSQTLFAAAPFLGAIASWAILGEPVSTRDVVAALVMLAGVGLLLFSRHAHVHAHAPMVHAHGHRHDDDHHDHEHSGLPPETWHSHEHAHEAVVHAHLHAPDLHHRHEH
jgi:drug/metabolite transporter (DMT)-like permease